MKRKSNKTRTLGLMLMGLGAIVIAVVKYFGG